MLWRNNSFSVQVAIEALFMVLLDWLIRCVFYYSSSNYMCGACWLQSDCLWCTTIKDVQEEDKTEGEITNGF